MTLEARFHQFCGNHDCMILYAHSNLYYKHLIMTSPNYNKCYVSSVIISCYEEKTSTNTIKLKTYNISVVRQNCTSATVPKSYDVLVKRQDKNL